MVSCILIREIAGPRLRIVVTVLFMWVVFITTRAGRKLDGILIPPLLPVRRVMMAMFGFPDLPDESTWTERAWRL